MKNKEKYANEIFEIACSGNQIAMDRNTKELKSCCDVVCSDCGFWSYSFSKCSELIKKWCEQEYIEYEIDWNKVPVDTPVLVRLLDNESVKMQMHFCKYENDVIYYWVDGKTSFSVYSTNDCMSYGYVELAREEDKVKYRKIKGN